MRIAVIGSGISGNAAAWALSAHNDVTVYERRDRPGGHSATVDIDYDGEQIAVDTGFIVYNQLNYPNLTALFDHLGVATEESNMGFSVSAPAARLEWSGSTYGSIFAQKRNLVRPSFLWMLREILRFNRQCLLDRDAGLLQGISLGQYLALRGFSDAMQRYYLIPMGAAIWSTSPGKMLDFPATSFVDFFDNHRLLHEQRPVWRTVTGGSREYVKKLIAPFEHNLRLGADISAIERVDGSVTVHEACGRSENFDHVVIATHSDQALKLLGDASHAEQKILGDIRYAPNTVYLHRDRDLMPRREAVWSAWNYMCPMNTEIGEATVSVSYWMNQLQNIDKDKPIFISLNPVKPPRPELTFGEFEYDHPQFDAEARAAQQRLAMLQGERNTWYCGAYHGNGFHEDGVASGLDVAERLGATIPWRAPERRIDSPFMVAAD